MNNKFIDLHMHSTASDGSLTPTEVVELAHSIGITDMSLTDHETIKGLDEASKRAAELGINFIRGIELFAYDKDACGNYIHILGYDIKEMPKVDFQGSPVDVIKFIHDVGGKAFIAHPYLYEFSDDILFEKLKSWTDAGLDGVECFYSRHTDEKTQTYLKFAKELGLLISGGCDFHGFDNRPDAIGYGLGDKVVVNPDFICWI